MKKGLFSQEGTGVFLFLVSKRNRFCALQVVASAISFLRFGRISPENTISDKLRRVDMEFSVTRKYPFVIFAILLFIGISYAASSAASNVASDNTGQILGRVINEYGEPIAQVDIGLSVGSAGSIIVGETDAEGYYFITDLSPAQYSISFDTNGNNVPYLGTVLDYELIVEVGSVVDVGDTVLVQRGLITGSILMFEGHSPSTVNLTLSLNRPGWVGGPVDVTNEAYLLYEDGQYIVGTPFAFGSYVLRVWATVDGSPFPYAEYYDDALAYEEATPIIVSAGQQIENIDFVLDHEFLGEHVRGTLSGNIKASASPFEGVRVDVFQLGSWWGQPITTNIGHVFTDANGDYEFEVTPFEVGHYKLKFSTNGSDFADEYYDDASTISSASVITISEKITRVTDLDAVLQYSGMIEGFVTESYDGEPLADIQVVAYSQEAHGYEEVSRSSTALNGVSFLRKLKPGAYRLLFSDPLGRYSDQAREVFVQEMILDPTGISLHVADPAQPTTEGQHNVVNAFTQEPIESATVSLYRIKDWYPDLEGFRSEVLIRDCRTKHSVQFTDFEGSSFALKEWGTFISTISTQLSDAPMWPNTNPQLTNSAGEFGWQLSEGCWFVVVHATGYHSATSVLISAQERPWAFEQFLQYPSQTTVALIPIDATSHFLPVISTNE